MRWHAVAALKSAGYRLAVCTNKPEGLAELLMARLGVRRDFDALVGSRYADGQKTRPGPLPARRWSGRAARRKTRFWLGDTVTDFDTARAAGVPVVLVTFGDRPARKWRPSRPMRCWAAYSDLSGVVRHLIG